VSQPTATWTADAWPEDFRRLCQLLLHQQCWHWGQDIRHPQGNLLLAYGFKRVRPPAGTQGSSRYQLRLSSRSAITLWGFGLYFARCGRGGVYLNRYDCTPRFCHQAGFLEHVWTRDALPLTCSMDCSANHGPGTAYLVLKAAEWMSRYEIWVLRQLGVQYRREVLREWHEPAVLPEILPEEWLRLGHLARTRPGLELPHVT
jgi:hypothetical protein